VAHSVKFVGDFNVQIPGKNLNNSTWYRGKGFNYHSLILHDYLLANNLYPMLCSITPQTMLHISVTNVVSTPGLIVSDVDADSN